MEVFAESDVFATLSSSNAQLKGNDGKASRRLQKRKIMFSIAVSCSIFACLYFICTGKGFNEIAGNLRRQKFDKGEANKQKVESKNVNSRVDSWIDSQVDSQTDSRQKAKKSEEEEGRLITFHVSNLEGSPGNEGTFIIRTRPSWSPKGAQRFEDLTEQSFWDGCRFFRAISNFVVQWGINGDPSIQKKWDGKLLEDEKVTASNDRGTVVFAMSGPNTRETQMYINTGKKNKYLDEDGFTTIAEVVFGMDVVDKIYTGYGSDPDQSDIELIGNKYLEAEFPKLSFIRKAYFQ